MTTDTGTGDVPVPGHFSRNPDYVYEREDRREQAAKLLEAFEPLFRSQAARFAQWGQDVEDMAQEARPSPGSCS